MLGSHMYYANSVQYLKIFWYKKQIHLFIYCFIAPVLKVCRTPDPTALLVYHTNLNARISFALQITIKYSINGTILLPPVTQNYLVD